MPRVDRGPIHRLNFNVRVDQYDLALERSRELGQTVTGYIIDCLELRTAVDQDLKLIDPEGNEVVLHFGGATFPAHYMGTNTIEGQEPVVPSIIEQARPNQ